MKELDELVGMTRIGSGLDQPIRIDAVRSLSRIANTFLRPLVEALESVIDDTTLKHCACWDEDMEGHRTTCQPHRNLRKAEGVLASLREEIRRIK